MKEDKNADEIHPMTPAERRAIYWRLMEKELGRQTMIRYLVYLEDGGKWLKLKAIWDKFGGV